MILDGNARRNLATFCQTWEKPEIHHLMNTCIDMNMVDKDEYPQREVRWWYFGCLYSRDVPIRVVSLDQLSDQRENLKDRNRLKLVIVAMRDSMGETGGQPLLGTMVGGEEAAPSFMTLCSAWDAPPCNAPALAGALAILSA